MEVHQEEIILASKQMTFKGKRTKRQRTMSQPPFLLTVATATTSSSCSTGTAGGDSFTAFNRLTTSPSNSGELTQTSAVDVDREEDMANCLILLAQGRARKSTTQPTTPLAMPSTSITKSSSAVHDVYQCKTCNRCFPSFQALGGHRASHKKPKPTDHLEEKSPPPPPLSLGGHQETTVGFGLIRDEDTTLSLQIPSSRKDPSISGDLNKSRVHECSICGAEFSSGQALGGHMRRHRPLPTLTGTSSNDEGSREFAVKKPRALLSLDLNLPAAPDQPEPEDDYSTESKYPFAAAKQQVIVFSASRHPLVDCHY